MLDENAHLNTLIAFKADLYRVVECKTLNVLT